MYWRIDKRGVKGLNKEFGDYIRRNMLHVQGERERLAKKSDCMGLHKSIINKKPDSLLVQGKKI